MWATHTRGSGDANAGDVPRRPGRLVRNLASALVFACVVTGSVWGGDDDFPFAPFRMYSTTTNPSGTVIMPHFEGVTASGTRLRVETEELGLRTAEVLGQMKRFRRAPWLLGRLAETHAADANTPPDSRLVELSLVQGIHDLEDGRPHGYSEEIVSVWRER
ncbi:MAG: hypothetical protein H0T12_05120 [Actinobacteria bacterium]|nr:hypothetical protein [Actinomycetota bacterium]